MKARWISLSCHTMLGLVFLSAFVNSWAAEPAQTNPEATRVRATAQLLAASHDSKTGLFQGTGWWNSANGVTALADASRALHTTTFDPLWTETWQVAQQQHPKFLNEFYDDEGWWALAWLDVYRLRGDAKYLHSAQAIFTDMSGGWSDVCGGGIWWKKNERYKNAIANELFLSLAAQLAQVSKGREQADYLAWAQKEARWFLASGMINGEHLVNDGLNADCSNNGRTTWTYNQGVLLSGLAALSQLTHDSTYLATANAVAHAAAEHLTDAQGVLHDPCEPDCGADGIQFKGIFVRNLQTLLQASPSPALQQLLEVNANSIWQNARTPAGFLAVNWSGPPVNSGTGALISGLDALTADLLSRSTASSR